MATVRMSGNARVRLRWDDDASVYRASVSVEGRQLVTYSIGAPAVLERAVDSPEAFDATARAALTFALAEKLDVDPDFESIRDSGTGAITDRIKITRRRYV